MQIDNIFILIVYIKNLSPSHSEPSQTCKMEFFAHKNALSLRYLTGF